MVHDLFSSHNFKTEASKGKFTFYMPITSNAVNVFVAGDAELKQNKKLPAEQQIVTSNPDIRTVSSVAASTLFQHVCFCRSSFSLVFSFSFFLRSRTCG